MVDGTSPYHKRFGENFDQTKLFPFGAEVKFKPSKITGDAPMQFAGTTDADIFLGHAVNSSIVWSGKYLVSHIRQFATTNYHSGKREEDDKTIVVQFVRDVQRVDPSPHAPFAFPLKKHHDAAFNMPEGWLDSYWREQPPLCVMPTDDDEQTGNPIVDDLLRSQKDHLDDAPEPLPAPAPPMGVETGWSEPKPAVMVPTETRFVTIRPQLETIDTANKSDLESVITTAEWAKLEEISNLREFLYATWTDELFRGQIFELSSDARFPNKRIGEGPPMNLVVARTFLDMATGRILETDEAEQYRAPYVQVEDAEACPPIPFPQRTKLHIVHYYDPATWKPRGNWANGRWITWTKKTTRLFKLNYGSQWDLSDSSTPS
jgi:hypothetical protein